MGWLLRLRARRLPAVDRGIADLLVVGVDDNRIAALWARGYNLVLPSGARGVGGT